MICTFFKATCTFSLLEGLRTRESWAFTESGGLPYILLIVNGLTPTLYGTQEATSCMLFMLILSLGAKIIFH